MPEPNTCIDCGKAASGLRCKKCHGAHEALMAAELLAPEDERLLAMVAAEGLSPTRLAARLGVSRQSASIRVKRAQRRQALLQNR